MSTERRSEADETYPEAEWKPPRNALAMAFGVVVADAPGPFWLYIYADALRSADSAAYWFGQTPTGELSVTARYGVGLVLAVLWTGLVLALFWTPLRESIDDLRG